MSTWFRFYEEALDDPKVQRLSGDDFKFWVNILCLAKRHDGVIPSIEDVEFALRETKETVSSRFMSLKSAGLVDMHRGNYEPHSWRKRQYKSDTSTERVRRFRKQDGNVSVTPPETDTETDTETETEKKSLSVSKPKQVSKKSYPEAFEEIWKPIYGGKIYATGLGTKKEAFREWDKFARDTPPETILLRWTAYVAQCRRENQGSKALFRWINLLGFEQEYSLPMTGQEKAFAAMDEKWRREAVAADEAEVLEITRIEP